MSNALKRQSAALDVAPLAADYFSEIRALFALALTGLLPQLEECQRYLQVVRRRIDPPLGTVPMIFHERGRHPCDPPGASEPIPEEQLSWILDRVRALFTIANADNYDGD